MLVYDVDHKQYMIAYCTAYKVRPSIHPGNAVIETMENQHVIITC